MISSSQLPGKRFLLCDITPPRSSRSSLSKRTDLQFHSGYIRSCNIPFEESTSSNLKLFIEYDDTKKVEEISLRRLRRRFLVEYLIVNVQTSSRRSPALVFKPLYEDNESNWVYVQHFGTRKIEVVPKKYLFFFSLNESSRKHEPSFVIKDLNEWLSIQKTQLLLLKGPYSVCPCQIELYNTHSGKKYNAMLKSHNGFKRTLDVMHEDSQHHEEVNPCLTQVSFICSDKDLNQMLLGNAPKGISSSRHKKEEHHNLRMTHWEPPKWMNARDSYMHMYEKLKKGCKSDGKGSHSHYSSRLEREYPMKFSPQPRHSPDGRYKEKYCSSEPKRHSWDKRKKEHTSNHDVPKPSCKDRRKMKHHKNTKNAQDSNFISPTTHNSFDLKHGMLQKDLDSYELKHDNDSPIFEKISDNLTVLLDSNTEHYTESPEQHRPEKGKAASKKQQNTVVSDSRSSSLNPTDISQSNYELIHSPNVNYKAELPIKKDCSTTETVTYNSKHDENDMIDSPAFDSSLGSKIKIHSTKIPVSDKEHDTDDHCEISSCWKDEDAEINQSSAAANANMNPLEMLGVLYQTPESSPLHPSPSPTFEALTEKEESDVDLSQVYSGSVKNTKEYVKDIPSSKSVTNSHFETTKKASLESDCKDPEDSEVKVGQSLSPMKIAKETTAETSPQITNETIARLSQGVDGDKRSLLDKIPILQKKGELPYKGIKQSILQHNDENRDDLANPDISISETTKFTTKITEEVATSFEHPEVRTMSEQGETVTKIYEKTVIKHIISEEVKLKEASLEQADMSSSESNNEDANEATERSGKYAPKRLSSFQLRKCPKSPVMLSPDRIKELLNKAEFMGNPDIPFHNSKSGSLEKVQCNKVQDRFDSARAKSHVLSGTQDINATSHCGSSIPLQATCTINSNSKEVTPEKSKQGFTSIQNLPMPGVPVTQHSYSDEMRHTNHDFEKRTQCAELFTGDGGFEPAEFRNVILMKKKEAPTAYDSLVYLQGYICKSNYTTANISKMLSLAEKQQNDSMDRQQYFLKSLLLASQIPILEKDHTSEYTLNDPSIKWYFVFKKLECFVEQCFSEYVQFKNHRFFSQNVSKFDVKKKPYCTKTSFNTPISKNKASLELGPSNKSNNPVELPEKHFVPNSYPFAQRTGDYSLVNYGSFTQVQQYNNLNDSSHYTQSLRNNVGFSAMYYDPQSNYSLNHTNQCSHQNTSANLMPSNYNIPVHSQTCMPGTHLHGIQDQRVNQPSFNHNQRKSGLKHDNRSNQRAFLHNRSNLSKQFHDDSLDFPFQLLQTSSIPALQPVVYENKSTLMQNYDLGNTMPYTSMNEHGLGFWQQPNQIQNSTTHGHDKNSYSFRSNGNLMDDLLNTDSVYLDPFCKPEQKRMPCKNSMGLQGKWSNIGYGQNNIMIKPDNGRTSLDPIGEQVRESKRSTTLNEQVKEAYENRHIQGFYPCHSSHGNDNDRSSSRVVMRNTDFHDKRYVDTESCVTSIDQKHSENAVQETYIDSFLKHLMDSDSGDYEKSISMDNLQMKSMDDSDLVTNANKVSSKVEHSILSEMRDLDSGSYLDILLPNVTEESSINSSLANFKTNMFLEKSVASVSTAQAIPVIAMNEETKQRKGCSGKIQKNQTVGFNLPGISSMCTSGSTTVIHFSGISNSSSRCQSAPDLSNSCRDAFSPAPQIKSRKSNDIHIESLNSGPGRLICSQNKKDASQVDLCNLPQPFHSNGGKLKVSEKANYSPHTFHNKEEKSKVGEKVIYNPQTFHSKGEKWKLPKKLSNSPQLYHNKDEKFNVPEKVIKSPQRSHNDCGKSVVSEKVTNCDFSPPSCVMHHKTTSSSFTSNIYTTVPAIDLAKITDAMKEYSIMDPPINKRPFGNNQLIYTGNNVSANMTSKELSKPPSVCSTYSDSFKNSDFGQITTLMSKKNPPIKKQNQPQMSVNEVVSSLSNDKGYASQRISVFDKKSVISNPSLSMQHNENHSDMQQLEVHGSNDACPKVDTKCSLDNENAVSDLPSAPIRNEIIENDQNHMPSLKSNALEFVQNHHESNLSKPTKLDEPVDVCNAREIASSDIIDSYNAAVTDYMIKVLKAGRNRTMRHKRETKLAEQKKTNDENTRDKVSKQSSKTNLSEKTSQISSERKVSLSQGVSDLLINEEESQKSNLSNTLMQREMMRELSFEVDNKWMQSQHSSDSISRGTCIQQSTHIPVSFINQNSLLNKRDPNNTSTISTNPLFSPGEILPLLETPKKNRNSCDDEEVERVMKNFFPGEIDGLDSGTFDKRRVGTFIEVREDSPPYGHLLKVIEVNDTDQYSNIMPKLPSDSLLCSRDMALKKDNVREIDLDFLKSKSQEFTPTNDMKQIFRSNSSPKTEKSVILQPSILSVDKLICSSSKSISPPSKTIVVTDIKSEICHTNPSSYENVSVSHDLSSNIVTSEELGCHRTVTDNIKDSKLHKMSSDEGLIKTTFATHVSNDHVGLPCQVVPFSYCSHVVSSSVVSTNITPLSPRIDNLSPSISSMSANTYLVATGNQTIQSRRHNLPSPLPMPIKQLNVLRTSTYVSSSANTAPAIDHSFETVSSVVSSCLLSNPTALGVNLKTDTIDLMTGTNPCTSLNNISVTITDGKSDQFVKDKTQYTETALVSPKKVSITMPDIFKPNSAQSKSEHSRVESFDYSPTIKRNVHFTLGMEHHIVEQKNTSTSDNVFSNSESLKSQTPLKSFLPSNGVSTSNVDNAKMIGNSTENLTVVSCGEDVVSVNESSSTRRSSRSSTAETHLKIITCQEEDEFDLPSASDEYGLDLDYDPGIASADNQDKKKSLKNGRSSMMESQTTQNCSQEFPSLPARDAGIVCFLSNISPSSSPPPSLSPLAMFSPAINVSCKSDGCIPLKVNLNKGIITPVGMSTKSETNDDTNSNVLNSEPSLLTHKSKDKGLVQSIGRVNSSPYTSANSSPLRPCHTEIGDVSDIVSRYKSALGDKYAGSEIFLSKDGKTHIRILKYLDTKKDLTTINPSYVRSTRSAIAKESLKEEPRDVELSKFSTSPLKVLLTDCKKSVARSNEDSPEQTKSKRGNISYKRRSSIKSPKASKKKPKYSMVVGTKRKLKLDKPTIASVKKRLNYSKKIYQLQMKPCEAFPTLPKCLDCKDGDLDEAYCRFNMFRRLDVSNPDQLRVAGFCSAEACVDEDLVHWLYQDEKELNFDLCLQILRDVGAQFQLLVLQEIDAQNWSVAEQKIWKRAVLYVREMCDICYTTIFNTHWTCQDCGLGVCLDCFRAALDHDEGKKDQPYDWPDCEPGVPHYTKQLAVTQIIPRDVLVELLKDMLYIAKKIGLEFRKLDLLSYDALINSGTKQKRRAPPPQLAGLELISNHISVDESPTEDQVPVPPPECSWLCDNRMLHIDEPNFSGDAMKLFMSEWRNGAPILVSNVQTKLDQKLWSPSSLSEEFGHELNDVINCYDGSTIENYPIKKFWDGFESIQVRPIFKDPVTLLKLKDWPPKEDFMEKLPKRFADIMQALPAQIYTNRGGELNLAARLPNFFAVPDLGPKMYSAYGSASYPSAGTTNLHLDVSDATNVIAYVGIPKEEEAGKKEIEDTFKTVDKACCEATKRRIRQPGVRPGALWHIFPAHSAKKIRQFLRRVADERGMVLNDNSDPIHDQSFYLDYEQLEQLREEEGVIGYAICQCYGDAVFIPAGAPHQVLNLHSCIKVAEDFVAPEHISHCFQLTQEFRFLSDFHTNHEDKLQIKNIIFHSVKDCLGVIRRHFEL